MAAQRITLEAAHAAEMSHVHSGAEQQLHESATGLERANTALAVAEATRAVAAVATARASDAARRAADFADAEAARALLERHTRETSKLKAELSAAADVERSKLRARLAQRRESGAAAAPEEDAAMRQLESELGSQQQQQLGDLEKRQRAEEAQAHAAKEADAKAADVQAAQDAADARVLRERHDRERAALDEKLATDGELKRAALAQNAKQPHNTADDAAARAALDAELADVRATQTTALRERQVAEAAATLVRGASSAEGPGLRGLSERLEASHAREIAALVALERGDAELAAARARHQREYAEVDAARKLQREHVAAVAELETGLQRSASRAHALLQERLAERRQKHKARSAAGAVEGITFVASDTRAAAASIGPGEAEAKVRALEFELEALRGELDASVIRQAKAVARERASTRLADEARSREHAESLTGLINDAATKAEEEAKLAHADETAAHLKTIAMLRERLARVERASESQRSAPPENTTTPGRVLVAAAASGGDPLPQPRAAISAKAQPDSERAAGMARVAGEPLVVRSRHDTDPSNRDIEEALGLGHTGEAQRRPPSGGRRAHRGPGAGD